MCCKMSVMPLIPKVAIAILTTGEFKPTHYDAYKGMNTGFRRRVDEENTFVNAQFVGETLELSISPAISQHEHHLFKRTTGGIYFEIAARYAEKVNGQIMQRSRVVTCGSGDLVVAEYPRLPLLFTNVCRGFQEVFLGGQDEH